MLVLSLLPTVLLALRVAASPAPVVVRENLISLPLSRKFNLDGSLNFAEQDAKRARALKANGHAKSSGLSSDAVVSEPVSNQVVSYIASVGVGSPATTYELIVDTGSSNTWVGAGQAYVKTETSSSTGQPVSVTYGSGSFSGTEFTDEVTLAPGLVISKQSIGVASTSEDFEGVDGILGIGPTDLTEGTLTREQTTLIPTVTDNLFSAGTIPSDLVAISFEPTTVEAVTNGELTFGGTDASKFTGSITFTPITSTSPASFYWGINESITYGTTTILSTTAGIVDTGTTLIYLASNAYSAYVKATGAVLDNNTGLLRITSAQFAALKNLNFNIGGVTFTLTPNAQIWPRSLNTAIGGVSNDIYLVVNNLGTPSGEGFDFINGYTFLERFYSVFDTGNKRVGFATTPFTTATTN
uniref:Aspartic proteinase n=1 Tax=Mycena chlorophos TaxID=658473 RepID=A0ABQ0M284_MYCCL|nr:aspartic proteinase [Mycena chlorophos]